MSPHVATLSPVVGRDGELDRLHADLRDRTSPIVKVLCGMGGIGKTSLARAYAARHIADYRVIWWIRAEDPAAVDAEFRDLLQLLLPAGTSTSEIHDARATALSLLSRMTDPWLLVLDNVPDPAAAKPLVPAAGRGYVLITSQAAGWPAANVVFPVAPLSPDSSTELLQRLSLDRDQDTARALARELDHLPLALAQAASFVHANGIDLATYLRLYRGRSTDLHQENTLADYPHPVGTTWQLAMDRLPPTAAALLNLCAYLAPDAIPADVILSACHVRLPDEVAPAVGPLLSDELTRLRAVRELRAFSLITPLGGGTFTVHRLVQAVTRVRLTSGAWRAAAHSLVDAVIPSEDLVDARQVAVWKALRTHVRAVLHHAPAENAATLSTRRKLAYWTGNAGDPADARDQFAALLPVHKDILGTDHPDTLAARVSLAHWTGDAGDAIGARDQLTALLPDQKQTLGPEHPCTLEARHEIAFWTGEAGDPESARDQERALLPVWERVLGAENPTTLVTRANLARWTGEAGDPAGARDQVAALVPIRERVLGAEHPSTLLARLSLAMWVGEAGDQAAARDQLSEVIPLHRQVLGPDHPDNLAARHNLAFWTGKAGNPGAARDQLTTLVSDRERILGAEHPDTLTTRHSRAFWTGEAGDGESARDQFAALVPVWERVRGKDHRSTRATKDMLAYWTNRLRPRQERL